VENEKVQTMNRMRTTAKLKDIVLWQMKRTSTKEKDMEKEVSHSPPVTIIA